MKNISCILLMSLSFLVASAQQVKKNLDLIIVIDEEISVGSLAQVHIKAVSATQEYVIKAGYYPGNLSMELSDYDRLMSEDIKTILLLFDHYEYSGGESEMTNFEIKLEKSWLLHRFNILRIYNLEKKKYAKLFFAPKSGKTYVFEMDTSEGSSRLIRKKQ
ncbi:hypothetical protein [Chitinophaga arvensicola]|uniref:Uncharacterized protein n=1 Tax=Chitinophaga arvensicola TaxID=29529 RepID=A0A1I0SB77_9BACT|nr:hypothetical protein [Chitinophaga arvensicola]SEW53943.1 hypothetical protein SAMN04488122_5783 [Chitinophaga arvensicola]